MSKAAIENPIINSPFEEPCRHFKFGEEGITSEIVGLRRSSSHFIPIPKPKKKGKQEAYFDTEWTQDRIEENGYVNRIRDRVRIWRDGHYAGVTPVTSRLLEYWTDTEREKKLFFCQIEALETVIYITEAARKFGDTWIENDLRTANDSANPGLFRLACKMATGSGKTVVMGMLIAWQALNKLANTQDARFSDAFLLIAPGITIRDRLRVLMPNDPENYYRQRDLLPPASIEELKRAKILIINYHSFNLRDTADAARLTKKILAEGMPNPFKETPGQMVRRVCRDLGNKKNIIVINDEAHHCYRSKPDEEGEKLNREEKEEATENNKRAHVWLSGIEAIKQKIGVRAIFDVSATPFFLRGSGYPEGTLFPWVVSDFSLIDAIESGIVKIPRVPVADDAMMGDVPTYRDLWLRIRENLPKKGRKTEALEGEPILPKELQGAIHSLYDNYREYYKLWEENTEARERGLTPPVFIVVCNNTNVSNLIFKYIAGFEKKLPKDRTVLVPGSLDLFSNVERERWSARPKTILVDSQELESGEGMNPEFKKIASTEIDEFKQELRERFPGRDVSEITDEELLREVMNTVGKFGKLGEHIRCVVSVSMLTEGWDANTVTHILGVRAFGTQLLCEQVVGRALRRMSYAPETRSVEVNGQTIEFTGFAPEYAEVYGVPFSFIQTSKERKKVDLGATSTRVRALEERSALEITFPRVLGYRNEIQSRRLTAKFTADSKLSISTQQMPSQTIMESILGDGAIHTLDDLKRRRLNEVAFLLAKFVIQKYFRTDNADQVWLFPQILSIAKDWLAECVEATGNAFPQMLLLSEWAHNGADRIYKSIVEGEEGEPILKPILPSFDPIGSTKYVDFDTRRPTYKTRADKCHVSHVVADTESWEQRLAHTLEYELEPVLAYVKNDRQPGFRIPYTMNGEPRSYLPDFIANIDTGHGTDDPLHLIIEVTGERKPEKEAKVSTARSLWIPAVNNHGGFGRWAFVEIDDPWNAVKPIREAIDSAVKGYVQT